MKLTRREALATAAAIPGVVPAAAARPAVALFSKPLQHLDCKELGRKIRQFGLRSVDLTVRPGGHVPPEGLREGLPRAAADLAESGVSIAMITTAITSAAEPSAGATLAAAGRLKVPLFKMGYWRYRDAQIAETLARVKRDAAGLAALAREYGVQAAWHNHSGDYVGHVIWDTREIIGGLDPRWIGYYFDTSHAVTEGGAGGWNIALRLALPRLKIVGVKDHLWERSGGKWRRRTCPLGEGMVDFGRIFSVLAAAGYSGPMSLHVEYETPDPVAAIARDAEFLSREIARAWPA